MLTIIIVTLNAAHTITTCINSVLEQTFLDYEILIIDGMSTDSTLDQIEKLAAYSKKIKFISEKDNGIYDAMNKGIKMARGEWIYFLGGDDKLYNEMVLNNVFNIPGIENYDVVYGSVYNNSLDRVYDGEFNYEKMCKDGICHQSIFYKKTVFDRYGLYDPEMKVYAHIFMDKLLFINPEVKWKYIDLIIAWYCGEGFSRRNWDKKYWKNAEYLLNKCFKNKLSNKIIYSSLLPIPKWQFNSHSFLMAVKIALKGGNFKGLYYWFNHPYQIARLTAKKIFK